MIHSSPRLWQHLVALGLIAAAATGCSTTQIAKHVELVAFSNDLKPGKSEPLTSHDCGIMVLGFGAMPELRKAVERVNARYVQKMEINYDFSDYFFWTKSCWYVHGEGFK